MSYESSLMVVNPNHLQEFKTFFVGVSLSEPHTSVTALRTRVCLFVGLDRPLTVNFK